MQKKKFLGVLAAAAAVYIVGISIDPVVAQIGNWKKIHAKAASEARENNSGLRTVAMSVQLQTLSQSMITRSLLAALKISKTAQIRALAAEREQFMSKLSLLRRGHRGLGLPPATYPKVLEKLARLEKEWSVFGPAVTRIIYTGRVTKRDVAIVAECIKPLAEGTKELIEVNEFYATGGRAFSALTPLVSQAESMQALIKKMTAEYLLVTYGYKVGEYQVKLGESHDLFDRTLKGLIGGDSELRLLPAPSPQINAELRQVERTWRELAPRVYKVVQSGQATRAQAPAVQRKADVLAGKMGKAVVLYKAL